MKTIIIESIPHQDQRYPTAGDWFYEPDGTLRIRVSEMGDWRHEALVAIHELTEVLLCEHRGITQQQVDDFDKAFEADRSAGRLEHPDDEPGDHPEAPYQREHCTATAVERLMAAELNVKWSDYADAVEKLP